MNSKLKVLVSVSCSWLEIMKRRVPLSSQKLFRFLPQKKKSLQQLICALTATPRLVQRGNLWSFSAVWYCSCEQEEFSFENMKTCRQIWNGKILHYVYFALDGHSTARAEPIFAQSVRLKSANDGNRGTKADLLESFTAQGKGGSFKSNERWRREFILFLKQATCSKTKTDARHPSEIEKRKTVLLCRCGSGKSWCNSSVSEFEFGSARVKVSSTVESIVYSIKSIDTWIIATKRNVRSGVVRHDIECIEIRHRTGVMNY